MTEGENAVGEVAVHYARAGEGQLASKFGWIAAAGAMRSGAVGEAAHFYQLVIESDASVERRADATAACARALFLAREVTRAGPLLELGADRLRQLGRVAEAARMEIRRLEGLAELGTLPVRGLLVTLAQVKKDARVRRDWEAVALALDAEVNLRHRIEDIPGIRSALDEMRFVAASGPLEAEIVARSGLALGVLFGDPDDALSAAKRAVTLTTDGRSYRLRALSRLMVVLQCRGMQEGETYLQVANELRSAAAKSGNVLLHFSVENNVAVAALDAGDLDRAEVLMTNAHQFAKGAEMDLNRLIQANNAAELALAQEEFSKATRAFAQAASYASASTPEYLLQLATAGLGLCALEGGGLAEARQRIEALPDPPAAWHYDPSTLLTFRARFLQRLGRLDEAIDLLDQEAAKLDNRLVSAWLKVRALQIRLLVRRDQRRGLSIAEDCQAVADHLGLRTRQAEFRALVDRLRRGRCASL
jgi:tetratricopeptide (TPR) repeat protein